MTFSVIFVERVTMVVHQTVTREVFAPSRMIGGKISVMRDWYSPQPPLQLSYLALSMDQ